MSKEEAMEDSQSINTKRNHKNKRGLWHEKRGQGEGLLSSRHAGLAVPVSLA